MGVGEDNEAMCSPAWTAPEQGQLNGTNRSSSDPMHTKWQGGPRTTWNSLRSRALRQIGISKDLPTTHKKPRQGALAALNVAAGPVGGGASQVVS